MKIINARLFAEFGQSESVYFIKMKLGISKFLYKT